MFWHFFDYFITTIWIFFKMTFEVNFSSWNFFWGVKCPNKKNKNKNLTLCMTMPQAAGKNTLRSRETLYWSSYLHLASGNEVPPSEKRSVLHKLENRAREQFWGEILDRSFLNQNLNNSNGHVVLDSTLSAHNSANSASENY